MARAKKTGHYFFYVPIGWDVFDPKVFAGVPIQPGSRVLVTKDDVDPAGYFRFILDEHGNRMSVCHKSLQTVYPSH